MLADPGTGMLLAWAAPDGTRARVAPLEGLDDAADVILPGADRTVLARRLFARRAAAVMTLRTTEGLAAVRVDADGTATPLQVR